MSGSPIGITFALPSESSDLVRRLRALESHDYLLTGKIDNPEMIGAREAVWSREVAILHTGVGAKNCNARLETLLHKMRPFVPEPPTCFAAAMILLASLSCPATGAVNVISSTSRLGVGRATAADLARLSASSVRFCSVFRRARSLCFMNAIA